MDLESLLMSYINSGLTKTAQQSSSFATRESRFMPDSTRRAFQSRMKGDAAVARVAAQNMEDGKAMVNVAQTNVTAIKTQLQGIQNILQEAAKIDYIDPAYRQGQLNSIQEHVDEIIRLATNAEFNGMKLLDGSAGNNGVVQMQAGNSPRNQKFANLLDSSVSGVDGGPSAMNFNNLASELNLSNPNPDQSWATTALDKVETYISRMQGLEAQYSYDYKSLDNLSKLFEEQADIFDDAAQMETSAFTGTSAAKTSEYTTADILQALLNASGNSVFSGAA